MVQLVVTPAVKAALEAYEACIDTRAPANQDQAIAEVQTGDLIEHSLLIKVSQELVKRDAKDKSGSSASKWHLDSLLRGTSVYRPAPTPKPQPSAQYEALMQRLRKEEEERQYERMIAPPAAKATPFSKIPSPGPVFDPRLAHGYNDQSADDEATLQDIDRQLTLIVNVLVSVIASGITIWFAARYWATPQRLALSMTGSIVIAVAEVVVYSGYIRRIQDAKKLERKKVEHREIAETWTTQTVKGSLESREAGSLRHRKGKHR